LGERQVVVARLVGHFGAQPAGSFKGGVGRLQLQFGHHQAGILAEELVHLEDMAAVLDVVPHLLHQAARAQLQQRLGVGDRDLVVELLAGAAELTRLEVEPGAVAGDAHPHRGLLPALAQAGHVIEVTLGHALGARGSLPPVLADDPELPFDLDGHGRAQRSNRAMDSTCAVCGDMSMAPAATRRSPRARASTSAAPARGGSSSSLSKPARIQGSPARSLARSAAWNWALATPLAAAFPRARCTSPASPSTPTTLPALRASGRVKLPRPQNRS